MFGRGRVRRDNSYDNDDGHDSLRVDVRMYSVAIPPFFMASVVTSSIQIFSIKASQTYSVV